MTTELRRPGLRIWLDGAQVTDADAPSGALTDLGEWVLQVEVDERADGASSLRMTVDLSPIAGDRELGDWDVLEHGVFAAEAGIPDFRLLRRVTVEFSLRSDDPADPEIAAVVFDGYITGVEPVFGAARVPDSRLVLTGMDASCLMHFETVTRPWHGLADWEIAKELFEKYGFGLGDLEEATPSRVETGGGLLQRGTDAEFLHHLARRNGFEWFLEPAQRSISPGPHPGADVAGNFRPPRVGGEGDPAGPQPSLDLFPREAPSLIDFRARYDSHQPTRIRAWHLDARTRRVGHVDVTDPGYARMGSHSRADVLADRLGAIQPVRRPSTTWATPGGDPELESVDIQTTGVPHADADLAGLARGDLREADWFAVGSGTVRCDRYPQILRSRRPVEVTGAGHLLDGSWYVTGVRHRWGVDPDEPEEEQAVRRYEADVSVVRNALGGLG